MEIMIMKLISMFLFLIPLSVKLTAGHNHENLCFGVPTGFVMINESQNVVVEQYQTVGSAIWQNDATLEMEKRFVGMGLFASITNGPIGIGDTIWPLESSYKQFTWEITPYEIEEIYDTGTMSLLGWMRLKINAVRTYAVDEPVDNSVYVIENLAITARGEMLRKIDKDTPTEHTINKHFAGVGEFVHDDGPICEGETFDSLLSNYQTIYCGGVSPYENVLSNGVLYSRSTFSSATDAISWSKFGIQFGKNEDKPTYFVTNFRMSQTYCNYFTSLKFRVNGKVRKMNSNELFYIAHVESPVIYFNESKLMGAADPIISRSTPMKCDKPLRVSSWNGYIQDVQYENLADIECLEDYVCFVQPYPIDFPIKNETTPSSSNDTLPLPPLFSGRCEDEIEEIDLLANGTSETVQLCIEEHLPINITKWLDEPVNGSTRDYETFINQIQGRIKAICEAKTVECPVIRVRRPTTTTPTPVLLQHNFSFEGITLKHYETLLETFDTRIYHGFFMTIITFFILPVNGFFARYYKETYMDTRIMYHRVWYFVHHNAMALILVCLWLGFERMVMRPSPLGYSLLQDSILHRYLGYAAVGLIIFIILTGGIRQINRIGRAILIAIHFILGITAYVVFLATFVYSTWIPGSPTELKYPLDVITSSESNQEINKTYNNKCTILLFVWISFDIVMHVALTLLQCRSDRILLLDRPRYYFPSPMPVLHEHFRYDLPGGLIRKILLAIYLLVSIIITAVQCITIMTVHENVSFGPTFCTHELKEGGYVYRDNFIC